ncbi:MAG: hypothetical protein FWG65_01380 [Turicibacter sp.]|nr:hypothetical protein [Turicibacter sp.]
MNGDVKGIAMFFIIAFVILVIIINKTSEVIPVDSEYFYEINGEVNNEIFVETNLRLAPRLNVDENLQDIVKVQIVEKFPNGVPSSVNIVNNSAVSLYRGNFAIEYFLNGEWYVVEFLDNFAFTLTLSVVPAGEEWNFIIPWDFLPTPSEGGTYRVRMQFSETSPVGLGAHWHDFVVEFTVVKL